MKRYHWMTAAFLAAVLVLTGCSGEEKLYNISGTITYDGKPVVKGVVHFDPDVAKGAKGTAGFANIVNGKYNTADNGKGVRGGPYAIRVNGFDGKEGPEAPFGQAMFPEYNDKHDLPNSDSEFKIEVKKTK